MAQVTFTIANGILEVSDGGGMYSYHSADYRAKSIWNSTRLRIVVYPILHELTPATRREWEFDDVADAILNGTQYGTVDDFVTNFNQIAGVNIGYNTKYPEILFSHAYDLDTSVDEQLVPEAEGSAGYIIITTPSTNTGNVYIWDENVNNTNYYLEPDKSITLEFNDLGAVYAQNTVADDAVMVIGAYKI